MTILKMISSNLSVSKIVATPTENSWAQAYNAGSLFAVLSLTKKPGVELDLNIAGKNILNTFEEEYYTLEEKNLETIKKAFHNTCQKIPDNAQSSFLTAAIVENILYIFTKSKARVILKRNDRIGSVLDSFSDSQDKENVTALSGLLEDNDLIVLSTEDFFKVIKESDLISAFAESSPSDIAENLTPKVHKQEEGGAASVFILYKKSSNSIPQENYLKEGAETVEEALKEEDLPVDCHSEFISESKEIPKQVRDDVKRMTPFEKLKNFLNFPAKIRLGHSKKVLLTISIVLISVLIISASFAIKKQEEAKITKIFQETFSRAQAKFNEGNALISLNKNLAREDLTTAQKILQENKSQFKPNSKELEQITALLEKTEKLLNETAQINSVSAKEVDFEKSQLLSNETKNSDSLAFSQDEKNIYFAKAKSDLAKGTEAYSLEKSGGKKKSIIKDSSVSDIQATSPYNGNVYVLDKKSKILKFTAADSGFVKSAYLKEEPSIDWELSKAMSIDGSVWVLMTDGTIYKFTKGIKDSFKVSGLDSPFIKPAKIFTNKETDNVYVLDNGNSRIVVLSKDGTYQSQYSANVIGDAKDFEVLEKDKKIYLLSGDKIYEIELK